MVSLGLGRINRNCKMIRTENKKMYTIDRNAVYSLKVWCSCCAFVWAPLFLTHFIFLFFMSLCISFPKMEVINNNNNKNTFYAFSHLCQFENTHISSKNCFVVTVFHTDFFFFNAAASKTSSSNSSRQLE